MTLKERERYENGFYSIRFVGESLKVSGVSIYDLSNSLLAVQRIVHKAHLSLEGRLQKGAFPNSKDRRHLALQLGERRRESDAFALVPMLADRETQQYMGTVAQYVIPALIAYYTKSVVQTLSQETDLGRQLFTASIFTEVANIINRVDASGGVEGISIGTPALNRDTVIAFDAGTKDYLNHLKGEVALGAYQEIQGRVYKLYTKSKIVSIRQTAKKIVDIHFEKKEDFDTIRYTRSSSPMFIFRGRPRYQFGVETRTISDFVAEEIEFVPGND